MSDPITTAFHAVLEARGATFMEEGGWLWSESFGDPAAEYAAVRDGVGMWDVSPLNKWDFRGPDAVEAAQRVHSNDILGLEAGQVRYGAFLDEDGLLVDDGTVFKHADDHLWVMTNGMEHAEYFAEATKGLDVSVDYIARELPNMQIQGPRSRELLRTLTDVDRRCAPLLPLHPRPGQRSAACRCGCRGRGSAASSGSSCSSGRSTRPICGRRWRPRARPRTGSR